MSGSTIDLTQGFEPTLFTIPITKRKKKVNLVSFFPFLEKFDGQKVYELTEKDVERVKVYWEQKLDIYLALMVEYNVSKHEFDKNDIQLRLFRIFPTLSGIVTPQFDDLPKLAEYLDCKIIDLEESK